MKKKRKAKKAQLMGMPFQFIFALILMAVVIFVGFYVIKMFLERAEQANINLFVQELKTEISNLWMADAAEKTVTFSLSKNFDYVCFLNQSMSCDSSRNAAPQYFCIGYIEWKRTEKDNMFLLPFGKAEEYGTFTAWHIACNHKECVKWQGNPLCLRIVNGKVIIKLTKESGSNFVKISSLPA